MSETLDLIKTRGYWRVTIRPIPYEPERVVNITELRPIVERTAVQLRGWDFPHVDHKNPVRTGQNYVEQDIDWEHHKEFWRIHQSGQFAYYGAYWFDWTTSTKDWMNQPPKDLRQLVSAGDVVCRYAEFFEFAAALSMSPVGSSRMDIQVLATGLTGREVWMAPGRVWGPARPQAHIDEFPQRAEFQRDHLVSETRSIALVWARELFRRFGEDLSMEILDDIRSEFR